jgi:hypothetical protein
MGKGNSVPKRKKDRIIAFDRLIKKGIRKPKSY